METSDPKFLTFDEIVDTIVVRMEPDDVASLTSIPKSDMIMFHFTVGMSIRNEFLLWNKQNPLTKQWYDDSEAKTNQYLRDGTDYHPNHPDQISSDILAAVWDKINGTTHKEQLSD